MTTIAAVVPDLMDRSRVTAAAGAEVQFVRVADLPSIAADVVVADLNRVDADDLRAAAPSSRIIGFASHVDDVVLAGARAAGIDEVLPRSAFFRTLPDLLA
jgi:hypothetical protein